MTPERWQKIKQILDATPAMTADRVRAFVEEVCGEDRELFSEVANLLALEESMDDFIDEPLWELAPPAPVEKEPPTDDLELGKRVGPYRIERVLGRGGMGTVFLATREDDYQQQVALKVVRWHIDGEQSMARFLAERQILANLRHPGIVRLLDGGTTAEGRPYLVMEYVSEGEPIDRYCARENLSLEERLRLFCKVCEVVHFAHRNLVVHRDLKPSNILVTPDGEPRLLDFGIAKLVSPEAKSSGLTAEGFGPMTPSCASPEQFLDDAITTACDVYALGVLLYHLLAGRPPYFLDGRSFAEIVQVICWREPEKPSQAVRAARRKLNEAPTIAEDESDSPRSRSYEIGLQEVRRLSNRLTGDLDAITLKALRKDPQHRYGSPAELADDIERHLQGLPVRAHQGSWFYNWGKFIRRNKLRLATAALVALLTLGFTAALAVQIERQSQVRSRADTLNRLLIEVFRASLPNRAKGQTISARDVLESGRALIGASLEDQPELEAQLLGTLGRVYRDLGLFEDARKLYEQALEIKRTVHRQDHPELARAINDLAALAHDQGLYEESERFYREALAMRRRLYGEVDRDVARTLNGLGSALVQQGRYDEAEEVFSTSLATRRKLYPSRHEQIASGLNTLGVLLFTRGNHRAAESHLREALEIRLEAYGPEHTETATSLNNLGRVLFTLGDLHQAEELYRQALGIRRRLLGDESSVVAITERNLALVLLEKGEHTEACAMARTAVESLRRVLVPGDWQTAEAESILGACLSRLGSYEEAEGYLLASFNSMRASLGDESSYTVGTLERLRKHYEAWSQPDKLAALPDFAGNPDPGKSSPRGDR